MADTDNNNMPTLICANCGKGEESAGDLKACTACKWLNIAIEIVKLHTAHNIKRHARSGPLNGMMRNYLNSLRQLKIVRFVCYYCLHFIRGRGTDHVAGKGFAMDAFMQLKKEIVLACAHFAEPRGLE